MKVPKKISKVWALGVVEFGYTTICQEAEVNYRTIKKAIATGECKPYIFDTINQAILRLRNRRAKTSKALIGEGAE